MAGRRTHVAPGSGSTRQRPIVNLFAALVFLGIPALAEASRFEEAADAHWAFRRLAKPGLPEIRGAAQVRTPVDQFVLARLEARGLTLSREADRASLLRRVYLDLIGLPPSLQEVTAFLSDDSADAYERVVDRLLTSPHFGERFARQWLDAAGYVDVIGTDNDADRIKIIENRWRYRDYIIHSINEDVPLATFLTEQLAGDELVDWRSATEFTPEIEKRLIATGFLRSAADDTDSYELNTRPTQHHVLEHTMEVAVTNLLGLSIMCAKCHDHKFEPIAQRDYYSLLAVFQPAFNPDNWLAPSARNLPNVAPSQKAAIEKENVAIDKDIAAIKAELAVLLEPARQHVLKAKLDAIPEPIRADVQAAVKVPAGQRAEVQRYLAEKFASSFKASDDESTGALSGDQRQQFDTKRKRIEELAHTKRGWQHWQVAYDVGPPTPTRLLRRGDLASPGAEVQPGLPPALCKGDTIVASGESGAAGATSGRRLAMARQLTDFNSRTGALVARVYVNRVWQRLFGRGIVETTENLGLTGAKPSHPELLEWLSWRFVAEHGRLKPLVRLLVTSSVYRQASSIGSSEAARLAAVDPENRLWGRMPLRRLEAEVIRDCLLATGGRLDMSVGGTPVEVELRPDGKFVAKGEDSPDGRPTCRRSIYLVARRNYHPTILDVFDRPLLNTNCMRSVPSAVVLQSLSVLNDETVLVQSRHFARRVAEEAADSPQKCIRTAFLMALSRPATGEEIAWCLQTMSRQCERFRQAGQSIPDAQRAALAEIGHMLLSSNEFLYAP